jgi:hypothetical protein
VVPPPPAAAGSRELAAEAGFGDAKVAAATDFNLIYELRP